jgi:hypothetical protein
MFLGGKKAQYNKDDGRILLGDNTRGKAVMLQPIRGQSVAVRIPIATP